MTKNHKGFMKRIVMCIMALFAAIILNSNLSNAQLKTYVSGNFKYKYDTEGYGVWIVRITPISKKGIKKLVIPEEIEGQKVVRIGGIETEDESEKSVFGVWNNPEGTGYEPRGLVDKVEKIETIVLPESLESMTEACFQYMSPGKSINIPANFVDNVMELADHNLTWKKVTISPDNPKYSVMNGCLLSKDKKTLHAVLTNKAEVTIPNKVKRIAQETRLNDATKKLYIPKSVTKIEPFALASNIPVQVSIAKKNTHYGVKKGSIYSKRTGRLVLGYINHGVLDIPDMVSNIPEGSYVGGVVKKIIIPKSVKEIEKFYFDIKPENLTIIFKKKLPPVLKIKVSPDFPLECLRETFCYPDKLRLLVPKGSKASYKKQWKLQKLEENITLKEAL